MAWSQETRCRPGDALRWRRDIINRGGAGALGCAHRPTCLASFGCAGRDKTQYLIVASACRGPAESLLWTISEDPELLGPSIVVEEFAR